MKIQAINTAYDCKNNGQNNSFKGIWGRLGVNYLDETLYHSAAFYPFVNGKNELVSKFYKGSDCKVLVTNGMTVEEGSAAYKFLFEDIQNKDGYKAVKKLRDFINFELATQYGNYNPLFLEKEDCADVNKTRQELKILDINAKLSDYENKTNPTAKPAEDSETVKHPMSEEEIWENLHRFGVA